MLRQSKYGIKHPMSTEVVILPPRQLARIGFESLPPVIARAGEDATRRFVEFFTANIRNKNTRKAYVRALVDFLDWCEARGVELRDIRPVVVAAYIEGHRGSKPTVKQHLAAIRMMFDYLVTGQVMPVNPASSVRGPKSWLQN